MLILLPGKSVSSTMCRWRKIVVCFLIIWDDDAYLFRKRKTCFCIFPLLRPETYSEEVVKIELSMKGILRNCKKAYQSLEKRFCFCNRTVSY